MDPGQLRDPETIEFLKGSKPENTEHEVALYHASPRDPVWEYVLAVDQARECIEEQASRVSFIGHSHVALWFSDDDGPPGADGGGQAEDGREIDLSEHRWLLNPGSVGQPRDGDPRAAWLELDTERVEGDLPPRRTTTSTGRRRRSGRPDCPNCSPTASTWANDVARFDQKGTRGRHG